MLSLFYLCIKVINGFLNKFCSLFFLIINDINSEKHNTKKQTF